MSDWTIFAERLSEQMKKQDLSIRQLAERMGMTPTTIFRYVKGQRVPRASEILKASDALEVTCDYLLGLSDDPKKTSRPSAQPEHTCVNCGRTVNNGGWYADGRTKCPIEEHYALPKDGYCHLWEKRNVTDDDYPERREE